VPVRVHIKAELTASPADEKPYGDVDDDDADRRLRRLLSQLRKSAVEKDDRESEGKQRRRMAKAPDKTQLPRATSAALASARNQRRDGDEVIRVGRVT